MLIVLFLLSMAQLFDTFDFDDKHIGNAGVEELQFIFLQAESQLKESLNSGELVISRATILLTILMAILASLLGIVINDFYLQRTTYITFSFLGLSLYIIFIGYELYTIFRGKNYETSGRQPSYLLHNWYFETFSNDKERLKNLLVDEIKKYQVSILSNNKVNEGRWYSFNLSLKLTIFLPIAFFANLAIFLLISIFL